METQRLKIAINATVKELTTLVQQLPQEIADGHIHRVEGVSLEEHVHDCNSQLQEALNLVLDARNKLILLGYYRIEEKSKV